MNLTTQPRPAASARAGAWWTAASARKRRRRNGQLQDHHRDRLAEVLQACTAIPCSAADILPVMFKRPLDLHQTTFAMGEAIAHLHLLWLNGQLQRSLAQDGIYRFSAALRRADRSLRKRHEKTGAGLLGAFGPYVATVSGGNALDNRQPQSIAGEVGG